MLLLTIYFIFIIIIIIIKVNTHQDDANGLAFSDSSGQILYTTGDDGLCKVWDRRAFITESPCPVGIFAGHKDGITHVDSRVSNNHNNNTE